MSDIGCDPSGNSISSFHVRADILHLLFCTTFFYFPCRVYARCDRATYLSLLFKFNLSER